MKTVIGLFSDRGRADEAAATMAQIGIERGSVRVLDHEAGRAAALGEAPSGVRAGAGLAEGGAIVVAQVPDSQAMSAEAAMRRAGASETAAVASGVNVKRMIVYSMLLSGAVAGLVGMPQLLGSSYSYGLDFPTGLGFTGIAIALLGRNSPIGIAFGALLWSFLDNTSNSLEFEGVPKQTVLIMQGIIVLSVVIAYELVRRYRIRAVAKDVGRQLTAEAAPEGTGVPA